MGGIAEFDPGRPIFQLDPFSSFVSAMVALAALLSCALSIDYLAELRINHGEFYALLLLSTCGMLLMIWVVLAWQAPRRPPRQPVPSTRPGEATGAPPGRALRGDRA
jgi:hypothetical protein